MRRIIYLLSLLIVSITAQAQKVKQAKNKISVDKKECLLIEKEGWQTYTLSTLGGEEICFVSWVQESPRETHQRISFPSTDTYLTRNARFSLATLVRKLLINDVVKNCQLETENIARFISKYDENAEESTSEVIYIEKNVTK